ncbi:XdhC family protein [Methylobrevis pamukkalensis]|uniref:Putative xanthine dehydrogenase subunit A n=1 Tax=Methylobrevis pamukkalensis TaxID=1439726 RepID=A0A1E3H112_9HYPH|nr:putative xanthine dehydrogenase subunit A [Methylobrevis pamukkalensis]
MDSALVSALNAERAARRAAVLATPLSGAPARLLRAGEPLQGDPLADEIREAFRSGVSRRVTGADGDVFLTACLPPPRLVIVGAVHISQALAPIAAIAGFEATIVDPRTAFATEARFAGVRLIAEWPEEVLPGLGLDPWTALAAVTHDPKIDDFALRHALERGCFYVGALGSRKTHGKRIERLSAAGVPADDLARIRARSASPSARPARPRSRWR